MTVPARTLQANASRICIASAPSRMRSPSTLLPGAFLLLTTLAASPTLASGNESWASETIEHMRRQTGDVGAGSRPRLRPPAIERLNNYMIDEEQVRPRHQHARRHDRTEEYLPPRRARAHHHGRKIASLSRASAPLAAAQTALSQPSKATELAPAAAAPKGPVVASLTPTPAEPSPPPKLSGGPINWVASPNCLASPLRTVLAEVASLFGAIRVNSTCRSKAHNARVGGASHSYHLTGHAVDFRIGGNVKAVSQFLLGKKTVGGFKHYGFGVFHIDTGPRRTWASSGRARRG
jgi:Peptidase M15